VKPIVDEGIVTRFLQELDLRDAQGTSGRGYLGTAPAAHVPCSQIYAVTDLVVSNYDPQNNCPTQHLEEMKATLPAMLGMSQLDFRLIPVIYKSFGIGKWQPYSANMVNALVFMDNEDAGTIFMTAPFCSEFEQKVWEQLQGIPLAKKFLQNGWECHRRGGEVHCGSNQKREPLCGKNWAEVWQE